MQSGLSALQETGLLTAVVTGIGGLGLGIYNTLQARADRRANLRVEVAPSTKGLSARGGLVHDCEFLRIINKGRVPVVLSTVGFELEDGQNAFDMSPQPTDGGDWPRDLAPGHQVMLKLDTKLLGEIACKQAIRRAFVTSAADDKFRTSRGATRAFNERLRHYASKRAPRLSE